MDSGDAGVGDAGFCFLDETIGLNCSLFDVWFWYLTHHRDIAKKRIIRSEIARAVRVARIKMRALDLVV